MMSWIQSMPGVWRTPSAPAISVPMNAATMPTRIVATIPMFWRPGRTRRPSAPMTAPMMMPMMMPATVKCTVVTFQMWNSLDRTDARRHASINLPRWCHRSCEQTRPGSFLVGVAEAAGGKHCRRVDRRDHFGDRGRGTRTGRRIDLLGLRVVRGKPERALQPHDALTVAARVVVGDVRGAHAGQRQQDHAHQAGTVSATSTVHKYATGRRIGERSSGRGDPVREPLEIRLVVQHRAPVSVRAQRRPEVLVFSTVDRHAYLV